MQITDTSCDVPIPLGRAARRLRVPLGWLRGEMEAGRLPGLRVGQSWLVHLPTVQRVLSERAARGEEASRHAG